MATQRAPFCSAWCMVAPAVVLPVQMAQADERWSGSIGASTDYVYRGVSQTDGGPALQGGVVAQVSGWSAGVWGSTVDVNGDGHSGYELDLHAMRTWALHPDWTATLGVTHYEYLHDDGALDYDHDELSASLSFQERLTATIAWSPNTSRWRDEPGRGQATAYELTFLQPLGQRWSVFAGAGHYDLHDVADYGYAYWSAGLTFTWASLQIDAAHIGADDDDASRSRWTGAVSVRF